MGKLLITVHSCCLFPLPKEGLINPRVVIAVDNTYRFHTRIRRDTLNPEYNETFVVGNTHRLATLEVCVYDVTEPTNLFHNLSPLRLYDMHAKKNIDVLIGRCFISIRRLLQNQSKTREYTLGTVHCANNETIATTLSPSNAITTSSTPSSSSATPSSSTSPFLMPLDGVAGTIKITLESDVLGELASAFELNDALERHYASRIRRFMLRYDKPKIQVIDILLSNVRDTTEVKNTEDLSFIDSNAVTYTGPRIFTIAGLPQLTLEMPLHVETFDQLMERLHDMYSSEEPSENRLLVTIDGCSMLHKRSKVKSSLFSSEVVYVLLRSEESGYVTEARALKETTVWRAHNCFLFDVVNPLTFVLHVIVMRRTAAHVCEIGRTSISASPLACNHASRRDMFLFRLETLTNPTITGNVHLTLRPENFGGVGVDEVCAIDEFYTRLGKFMRVYDPIRIPQVDMLIRCRLDQLEEFMNDLVVEHGREPGTVELSVTIKEVMALQADFCSDVHEKHVCVLVTMGELKAQTEPRSVRQFIATEFNRVVTFDVRRETDIIRIDVVHAKEPWISYGCVDFSCLHIQRGVANNRTFHLVANAGTCDAYLSGLVRVCLFSNDIGLDYAADTAFESMFVGRLRRYMITHMPTDLHRTHVIVATHFDMESYMAKLAAQYGAEDPTYGVYFTIIGCRQLRRSSMLWKLNPYVVVRIGVDCFQTKVARKTREPDYFEFCEFLLHDIESAVLTIVVMDRTDIGHDEEIGRATIPLCDEPLGQLHHDFVPLQSQHLNEAHKNIGTVGFKFTLVDLSLVDRTRAELLRDNLRLRERNAHLLLTGPPSSSEGAGWSMITPSQRMITEHHHHHHHSQLYTPASSTSYAGISGTRLPSQRMWWSSSTTASPAMNQISPRATSTPSAAAAATALATSPSSNPFANRLRYLASTFGAFKRTSERLTAQLARSLYLTSNSSSNSIMNSKNNASSSSNNNNNKRNEHNAYTITAATADTDDDYDDDINDNNKSSIRRNNSRYWSKNVRRVNAANTSITTSPSANGVNNKTNTTQKSRLAGYWRSISNAFTHNKTNSSVSNTNSDITTNNNASQSKHNSTNRSSYRNRLNSNNNNNNNFGRSSSRVNFYHRANDIIPDGEINVSIGGGNGGDEFDEESNANYDERDIRNLNEMDNELGENSITHHDGDSFTVNTPYLVESPECTWQRANTQYESTNNLLHEPFEPLYKQLSEISNNDNNKNNKNYNSISLTDIPPISAKRRTQNLMDECNLSADEISSIASESRQSSIQHTYNNNNTHNNNNYNVMNYYSNVNSNRSSEYNLSTRYQPQQQEQQTCHSHQEHFPTAAASVIVNSRFALETCSGGSSLPLRHIHTKWLRVRVLYCKNLLHRRGNRPSPYVKLATMYETHCTSTAFDTCQPEYNEEFIFKVDDMNKDALHVVIYTDTPYGPRKLGCCVFSLHNIPRDNPCQRHAALVIDPNQRRATECGSIFVLLSGDGCGLDCLPSRDAENRLRERVRDLLKTNFPRQLHRLEYYVGEFCEWESVILGEVFGKRVVESTTSTNYYNSNNNPNNEHTAAQVEVYISELNNITVDGFLVDGTCTVRLSVYGKKQTKLQTVTGIGGTFIVDQSCTLSMSDPLTASIQITVICNGHDKAGVCYLSLSDLHRGVPQTRTHALVTAIRSANPQPSGFITTTLQSNNYGSFAPPPSASDETKYVRLRRYYSSYLHRELATVDVLYANMLNVDVHLQRLVQMYGPEPGSYHLRLTVNRCLGVKPRHRGRVNPFCIIRCDLEEFRTPIVYGDSEFIFNETFDLVIGLPHRDTVELTVFNFFPAKNVLLGTTHIPLNNIRRNVNNQVQLPIISEMGTKASEVNGAVELTLFTNDFGHDLSSLQSFTPNRQFSSWLNARDSVNAFSSVYGNNSIFYNVSSTLNNLNNILNINKSSSNNNSNSRNGVANIASMMLNNTKNTINNSGSHSNLYTINSVQNLSRTLSQQDLNTITASHITSPLHHPTISFSSPTQTSERQINRQGTTNGINHLITNTNNTTNNSNSTINNNNANNNLPEYTANSKIGIPTTSSSSSPSLPPLTLMSTQVPPHLSNLSVKAQISNNTINNNKTNNSDSNNNAAVSTIVNQKIPNSVSVQNTPARTNVQVTITGFSHLPNLHCKEKTKKNNTKNKKINGSNNSQIPPLFIPPEEKKEVYLRITYRNKTLLRTPPIAWRTLTKLEKQHFSFELPDDSSATLREIITLKVGLIHVLHHERLSMADFSLALCAPFKETEMRLRLYDESFQFFAFCHMRVEMPDATAHVRTASSDRMRQRRLPPSPIMELITDDLCSLFSRYSPKDLRVVHVMLLRAAHLTEAHRTLRLQLAPEMIATVYIAIHHITLDDDHRNYNIAPELCSITAKVGNCEVSAWREDYHVDSNHESEMDELDKSLIRESGLKLIAPLLRIDIANWCATLPIAPSSSSTNTHKYSSTSHVGNARQSTTQSTQAMNNSQWDTNYKTSKEANGKGSMKGNRSNLQSNILMGNDPFNENEFNNSSSNNNNNNNSGSGDNNSNIKGSNENESNNATLMLYVNAHRERTNENLNAIGNTTKGNRNNSNNNNCKTRLGEVAVSLRALLTPACYAMREQLTLPLVNVQRESNNIHARLAGSITFSIHPCTCESYPAQLRYPKSTLVNFNRPYVRYYGERIARFLSHYDAHAVSRIHVTVYDEFVARCRWKDGLPLYLDQLIERWGPECDVADKVPEL